MILFISIDLILYSLSDYTDVNFFYSDMFMLKVLMLLLLNQTLCVLSM